MQRTVMIIGASSGIGRASALALASRGDAVILVARRRDVLEEVAAECRLRGARDVHVHPLDITDRGAVQELFAQHGAARRLDAVVHAAAVAAYGRFTEVPGEVFDRVQAVNVAGTANVAREAIRLFEEQNGGHLVLFGSVVGKTTAPYLSPYVVSKWAVHGLARTLQGELRTAAVHVSLIEPGGVDTSLYEKAASYLGVQGKPPPPVLSAEKVAKSVLGVLDRPRRERSIGLLNPVLTWGFRLLPPAYDRMIAPMMSRLGLGAQPVADHTGNLFETLPEPRPEEKHHARRG